MENREFRALRHREPKELGVAEAEQTGKDEEVTWCDKCQSMKTHRLL